MTEVTRTIDVASPVWITQTTILAVLILVGAWSLYQGKAPSLALEQASPESDALKAPLIDWTNNPKLFSLALMAIAVVSFVTGWGTMVYLMITNKPLASLKSDSSWISLLVLVPILLGTIYYFWTGSSFPRLMNLLVLSLVISVIALISSQTQVNT
jgi:hypothetical protein